MFKIFGQILNINIENDTTKKDIEGIVKRISPDVKGGNTSYYLTIDSDNNIFVATSKVSTELPLTVVGDKVKIAYQEGKTGVVDIIEFDNLNLGDVIEKNKSENSTQEESKTEDSETDKTESENTQDQ